MLSASVFGAPEADKVSADKISNLSHGVKGLTLKGGLIEQQKRVG